MNNYARYEVGLNMFFVQFFEYFSVAQTSGLNDQIPQTFWPKSYLLEQWKFSIFWKHEADLPFRPGPNCASRGSYGLEIEKLIHLGQVSYL